MLGALHLPPRQREDFNLVHKYSINSDLSLREVTVHNQLIIPGGLSVNNKHRARSHIKVQPWELPLPFGNMASFGS
jgi:hypothetical protein